MVERALHGRLRLAEVFGGMAQHVGRLRPLQDLLGQRPDVIHVGLKI